MFIFSLPILFSHIELGSPLELLLIALFLYFILFIATPFVLSVEDRDSLQLSERTLSKYLQFSWVGQLKLWFVFWPFFIILNISLYAIDILAKQGSITVSSWDEIHFILITPVVFWTVAVWRNSKNSCSRLLASGARLMTLAVFFEYGLKLIIRRDYPRIMFDCSEIILDYAACF